MEEVKKTNDKGDILAIKPYEQYRTVDELFEKSQPNSVYYTLLFISALVITAGILLGNSAIVIGGMLLTPVLTPVLLVSLGVTSGELGVTRGAFYLILKSSLIIIVSGIILAFVFGSSNASFIVDDSVRTAALYFIVAVASGVAGTFAWARRDVLDILPGVAIAVSLVPPLSLVGIGLSHLDFGLARFNFLIFLFNLLGILVGSLVVFSLLHFSRAREEVVEKAKEVEQVARENKESKQAREA